MFNSRIKKKPVVSFASSRKTRGCPTCLESGIVVYDTHKGDEVCNKCGQILQERVISEEQEWRSFSNNDGGSAVERSRVGAVNDVWLNDSVSGTTMMGGDKKFKKLFMAHDLATGSSNVDRQLKTAFSNLRAVAEHLNLKNSIVERCREILRDLNNNENTKIRTGITSTLGLIYFTSKEESEPVHIKALTAFDLSIKEKDILRSAQRIRKAIIQFSPTKDQTAFASRELATKACIGLDLPNEVSTVAASMCVQIEQRGILENPKPHYIAAATIFLACQLVNGHIKIVNLLHTTHCGITSFVETYTVLRNSAKDILPTSFVPMNVGGIHGLIQPENLAKLKSI